MASLNYICAARNGGGFRSPCYLFLSLKLGNNISEADAIFCVLQGEVIPDKFESKRKRYRLGKVPGSTFFKWGRERVSKRRRPAPAIPAVRLFARPTGGRLDRYPFINPIRGGHPNNHKKKTGKARLFILEVTPGFEPGNQGFADPCLTTWLCHR